VIVIAFEPINKTLIFCNFMLVEGLQFAERSEVVLPRSSFYTDRTNSLL